MDRKISSPVRLMSAVVWIECTLKLRKIEARTIFSSIKANFWPVIDSESIPYTNYHSEIHNG